MFRSALVLSLLSLAWPVLAHTASAQEVPAAQRATLLAKAKWRYYNVAASGVTGFSCDVAVDWMELFRSVSGADLAADDPSLMYLQKTHISFNDHLAGSPEFKWEASGDPPAEKEKSLAQVRNGLEMMVNGFLAAWNPTLNGTLIPKDPSVFSKTPTGYLIYESRDGQEAALNLNDDLVAVHLGQSQANEKAEMDTTFSPSPGGLLLTRVDSVVNTPPTAPALNMTMTTAFATVDGAQIPSSLAVTMQGKMKMDMTFSGCAVHRLADPAATPPVSEKPDAPVKPQEPAKPDASATPNVP